LAGLVYFRGIIVGSILQYIDDTSIRLELALEQEDWEAVKLIDDELRVQLIARTEPADALSAESSQNMARGMRKLADTYQRVLRACEQHRNDIKQEMMGLHRSRKGISAYQSL
jgi:hypothetical protein